MKKDKQLKDIKRRRTCKIVCVLLFLLISVIGICVHFNIIKIPFVVDLLERTEQKQEFGDFSIVAQLSRQKSKIFIMN